MARCDLTLLNFLPILGAIFSKMRQYLSTYSLLKLNMMQGYCEIVRMPKVFLKIWKSCVSSSSRRKKLGHFLCISLTLH